MAGNANPSAATTTTATKMPLLGGMQTGVIPAPQAQLDVHRVNTPDWTQGQVQPRPTPRYVRTR